MTKPANTPSDDRDYVLRMARDHNVEFVRLWFTDVLGFLKSFAITAEDLEEALQEGVGFDGSSIEGFARIDESDMLARPDPNTFAILPWRTREKGTVARLFCDIVEPDGKLHQGDPRGVLRRNLKRAADMGYTFYVGPEVEFFYFKLGNGRPEALDQGGYFDLTPLDIASDLRRETVLTLEEMGIGVESSHHEASPSQHEVDLRYTDALTMADNTMTFRLVVKEIAMKYGFHATFMPKPVYGQNGSGMHTHVSLFKGNRNTFFDKRDPHHLSPVARHFIAGLLKHAPEITLLTNQWVNSYKRLVPGYEAPVYVTWALKNRSDLIRIPAYKPGHEASTRLEYRSPDPACNPYLAFSVMLAAGLEGIEKKYKLPEAVERNAFTMTDREREELGIQMLPSNLNHAIELAERSPLVRRCLGDHVVEKILANKKIEWESYRAQVTDYELGRYLPIL